MYNNNPLKQIQVQGKRLGFNHEDLGCIYGIFCDRSLFYMGRLRPEVLPLTLLYTIFFRKGTPFVILLLEKGTPFIYLLKKTYE